MDQPTIYSETVREKVGAFGVRRSASRVHSAWWCGAKRSKPARQICRKKQYCRRAEFFALPISCPRKPQALLALLVTDY
jgi:hypothetical protein